MFIKYVGITIPQTTAHLTGIKSIKYIVTVVHVLRICLVFFFRRYSYYIIAVAIYTSYSSLVQRAV